MSPEGKDYILSYTDNIEIGTAGVSVRGIGNYKGNMSLSFQISKMPISSESISVTLECTSYEYNGFSKKPDVTVKNNLGTLKLSRDYTISYKNNYAAGTAQVIITGTGNYIGTITKDFYINQCSIADINSFSLSAYSYKYDGKEKRPSVSSSKLLSDDYTVEYENNINVGIAKVIITGQGNYTGRKEIEYTIKKASGNNPDIKSYSGTYDGKPHSVEISNIQKGSLVEYSLDGENWTSNRITRTQVGKTYVYIRVTNPNYDSHSETSLITISRKGLDKKQISLSSNYFTYNRLPQKPSVIVSDGNKVLQNGQDYSISLINNNQVGTANITVKGINNYTGSETFSFKIYPVKTSITKVIPKKKGLKLVWKKQKKEVSGYQLQYSLNSKFKNAKSITIKTNAVTQKTITKLKSNKKYYLKIRTYKIVNEKGKNIKYYSKWSSVRKIKVK